MFDVEFVAPRTPTESALAEIWAGVLAFDRIGVRDDFFDLDGDSLLAIQIVGLIRERLAVSLSMVDVFETGTISALAARLGRG